MITTYDVEQAIFKITGEYPDEHVRGLVMSFVNAIDQTRQNGNPVRPQDAGYDEIVTILAILVLNEKNRQKRNRKD